MTTQGQAARGYVYIGVTARCGDDSESDTSEDGERRQICRAQYTSTVDHDQCTSIADSALNTSIVDRVSGSHSRELSVADVTTKTFQVS